MSTKRKSILLLRSNRNFELELRMDGYDAHLEEG